MLLLDKNKCSVELKTYKGAHLVLANATSGLTLFFRSAIDNIRKAKGCQAISNSHPPLVGVLRKIISREDERVEIEGMELVGTILGCLIMVCRLTTVVASEDERKFSNLNMLVKGIGAVSGISHYGQKYCWY